jgi:hypothetical protein
MYAMVCTRQDIAYAVGVLSSDMSKLGNEHLIAIKRVFRDLHGTTDYEIFYQGRPRTDKVLDIHGFVDVDWVRDLDHIISTSGYGTRDLNDKRSTSGYVFNIFGVAIDWMSKRQVVVALSTTKVEYMATTHTCKFYGYKNCVQVLGLYSKQ